MPLSYEVDGDIVVMVSDGKIGHAEHADFIRALVADPAVPRPLKVLRDSRAQIGPIGALIENEKPPAYDIQPDMSIAIVTNDDLVFGMSRVFQGQSETTDNIKVFRDYEDAREWLLNHL